MDQEVPQKIGKYQVLAELGRSAVGVVYLALDPSTERKVAVKTLLAQMVPSPEILQLIFRDAQSAGSLQHRNLAATFDVGESEGRPYLAMELVEGESLQSIINLRAHLPLAAKLKLIQQACEGLGFAHQHGVVHRDVKPANILVTNNGVVKIVDFGMSHLESGTLTRTGKFPGTLNYASPEQINDGHVDRRSDVWALAAVTYEFIAYRKAFEGSNFASTIAKILTSQPEALSVCCPGVTAELDPIIAKGLAKIPDQRYSTFEEMLEDLGPVALRLQQSLIGELIGEAKVLRDQGETNAARQKLRATLILDPSHPEANALLTEIQSEIDQPVPAGASHDGVSTSKAPPSAVSAQLTVAPKQDLERVDELVEAGRYLEARDQLQQLQKEHGDSTEIRLKLEILEPFVKTVGLVGEARKAMTHQEFGEAIRLLNSALALNPRDSSAAELRTAAIKERDRLRQVREALSAGQKAMREGNSQAASIELQRLLELEPSHVEGANLMSQLQNGSAAEKRESKLSDGLQQVERLFAEKKFEDAQFALIELQQEHPESTVVDEKLQSLQSQMKRLQLVRDGEQALEHGEFGEAVRILTEAQQLAPSDEHIRELKTRAVQERDRLRQVREAIASGQRALREDEYEIAESQFERALRLDPASSQAKSLLEQARARRKAQAREEALMNGLKLAEEFIAAKKLDEAQVRLDELKKDHPEEKRLEPLFESLRQKKAAAAAVLSVPKSPAPGSEKRPAVQPTPAGEYTRSMALAEELRRSLQNLKPPSPRPKLGKPEKVPSPASVPLGGQGSNETLVRGAVPAKPSTPPEPGEPNATIASSPKLTAPVAKEKAPILLPDDPENKPDQE